MIRDSIAAVTRLFRLFLLEITIIHLLLLTVVAGLLIFAVFTILFPTVAFTVVALEGVVGDVVQSHHGFVGVAQQQVFTLLQLHTRVDDDTKDAPRVVHIQRDLLGEHLQGNESEVFWLEIYLWTDKFQFRMFPIE